MVSVISIGMCRKCIRGIFSRRIPSIFRRCGVSVFIVMTASIILLWWSNFTAMRIVGATEVETRNEKQWPGRKLRGRWRDAGPNGPRATVGSSDPSVAIVAYRRWCRWCDVAGRSRGGDALRWRSASVRWKTSGLAVVERAAARPVDAHRSAGATVKRPLTHPSLRWPVPSRLSDTQLASWSLAGAGRSSRGWGPHGSPPLNPPLLSPRLLVTFHTIGLSAFYSRWDVISLCNSW